MEYCPVAWQRHNTQVSVKQPTSGPPSSNYGQREKRPSTQVSNAHSQMLWKSCSLSPCKEKAVNSSLQVAKSWMFYQDSSNWLNCSFFGLCLTRYNSKILLFLITSTVLKKLSYLTVVKRVSNKSMLAAQEQVKSNPAYAVNGEVQVVILISFCLWPHTYTPAILGVYYVDWQVQRYKILYQIVNLENICE